MADNFTVQQIRKYYEIIQRLKLRDAQLHAISTFHAIAAAFGSVKPDKFREFLESLSMEKKNLHKTLDQMKHKGLPIEDK